MRDLELKRQLKRHEGVVKHVYKDSLGFWTLGVGFLVDKAKSGEIPEEVMDFWLGFLIDKKRRMLNEALPWFKKLDSVRQDCLINMAYNLGVYGLLGFKITLALVAAGKYPEAAKEMLKSRWAEQVGLRARELSEQMRTGEYAKR